MAEAEEAILDAYYDEHLPKMNDYLDRFSEEQLDQAADRLIRYIAFCAKYMKNIK